MPTVITGRRTQKSETLGMSIQITCLAVCMWSKTVCSISLLWLGSAFFPLYPLHESKNFLFKSNQHNISVFNLIFMTIQLATWNGHFHLMTLHICMFSFLPRNLERFSNSSTFPVWWWAFVEVEHNRYWMTELLAEYIVFSSIDYMYLTVQGVQEKLCFSRFTAIRPLHVGACMYGVSQKRRPFLINPKYYQST